MPPAMGMWQDRQFTLEPLSMYSLPVWQSGTPCGLSRWSWQPMQASDVFIRRGLPSIARAGISLPSNSTGSPKCGFGFCESAPPTPAPPNRSSLADASWARPLLMPCGPCRVSEIS